MRTKTNSIPIIDLFAGPGGLGEGFARFSENGKELPYRICLSIEKDSVAHQTLPLCTFFANFRGSCATWQDHCRFAAVVQNAMRRGVKLEFPYSRKHLKDRCTCQHCNRLSHRLGVFVWSEEWTATNLKLERS